MIVVTGDIHFGEKNLKQIKYSFDYFLDFVKEYKPSFVIIAGDYFDKKLNSDSEAYKEAIKGLVELSKNTDNLIVIKGTFSHDGNQLSVLNEFRKLNPNIRYYDVFTIEEINGIKFAFIPEEYPKNPNDYYRRLYEENFDLIIGHGMLLGAKLHNGIINRYIKDLSFNYKELDKRCKFNIWGHIHIPQQLSDKSYYTGSLARWQFGEEDPKRFLVINEEKWEIKSIKTPAYQYLTFSERETEDNLALIENLLNDKKTFVRIIGDKDNSTLKHLKEKFTDKVKIQSPQKESLDNVLKYEDINKFENLEDKYFYMIEQDIKTKKLTKKQKEFLKKEEITPLIEEMIKNTKIS